MAKNLTKLERVVRATMGLRLQRKVTWAEAEAAVDAFRVAVKFILEKRGRSGALRVPELGTFRRTTRKARRIRAVNADGSPGDSMMLPETHSVRFSPCGEWRRSLR